MATSSRDSRILEIARSWIGTPYVHQAALKGAGCDCLGLIRGVYTELYGTDTETPPAYSPDWAEETGVEAMRDAARRHLLEIALGDAQPGDVVLFRMKANAPAKHAAILSDNGRIIHAYQGHAVAETAIPPGWDRRLAYAFAWPLPECLKG
ncbi:MAG TPA: peptidase P60 [Methylothermaceae bacterium]|nr:peptidase P60 [Methylothermaceae bacterium]